jgi:hypothetical protein
MCCVKMKKIGLFSDDKKRSKMGLGAFIGQPNI